MFVRQKVDLQAADGVGDTKFDEWVALAWSVLYNTLKSSSQSKGETEEIESFVNLPHHIQNLVFLAAARSSKGPRTLGTLLATMPHIGSRRKR